MKKTIAQIVLILVSISSTSFAETEKCDSTNIPKCEEFFFHLKNSKKLAGDTDPVPEVLSFKEISNSTGIDPNLLERAYCGDPDVFKVNQISRVVFNASESPPTRTRIILTEETGKMEIEAEWTPLHNGGATLVAIVPKGHWRVSIWSLPNNVKLKEDRSWIKQHYLLPDEILEKVGEMYVSKGQPKAPGLSGLIFGYNKNVIKISVKVSKLEITDTLDLNLSESETTQFERSGIVDIVDELLATLAVVIVSRAKSGAFKLIQERILEGMGCNRSSEKITKFGNGLTNLCKLIDTMNIRNLATIGAPLVEALKRDLIETILLPKRIQNEKVFIERMTNLVLKTVMEKDASAHHFFASQIAILRAIVLLSDNVEYKAAFNLVSICLRQDCSNSILENMISHSKDWVEIEFVKPKHRIFARQLFTVLRPSKTTELKARLKSTIGLSFDVITKKENQNLIKTRKILIAILDNDMVRLLTLGSEWMKDAVCKEDDNCGRRFKGTIDFLGTFSVLALRESGVTPEEIAAQREARAEMIDQFVDTVTDRSQREGDIIFSLWGGVAFALNSDHEKNGYQPMRIPFGLALHVPAGRNGPIAHLSIAPLDLGHYLVIEETDDTDSESKLKEPDLTAVFRPSASLGLLWSYEIPIYVTIDFLWSPGVGYGYGWSLGFSVPLWDFN